jgi:hypothetical protein
VLTVVVEIMIGNVARLRLVVAGLAADETINIPANYNLISDFNHGGKMEIANTL